MEREHPGERGDEELEKPTCSRSRRCRHPSFRARTRTELRSRSNVAGGVKCAVGSSISPQTRGFGGRVHPGRDLSFGRPGAATSD